jgi:hypothetical protein
VVKFGFMVALQAGWLNLAAKAQDAPAAGGVVELPPMLVEESVSSVPWLYVNVDGTEFLSRCSASTTRHLVKAWLTGMQLVRVFVPPEFMARLDVPAVFVLYAQDMKQTVSAEIERELQAQAGRGESSSGARVGVAPSMRLSDRDMHASIAYIDESQFEAYALSVAPGHVGFLLRGRVPVLPAWLVEGIERSYRSADFILEPITLRPMIWNSRTESDALASDSTRPRAVLPANELFAPDAWRGLEKPHPRRVQARASTQELLFRWATVSGAATREAFWKFAARAAEGPVTEEMFEAIFGFDYSELRDRLSDHLPQAVERTSRVAPGRLPPLPPVEVERATSNQIARIRGEWERLAIGHVQRRLPQVREPYIVQARRTLRRAYEAGDRDPRLLATMGLCEIDAGNESAAREFLEPAVMAGVVRPRAYHELARLRFAELRRGRADATSFSYTELAPIIEPLRRGVKQSPPLPESFALLAEAWGNCEYAPNTAEFAELETGARLFVQRPGVVLPIARALARHGRKIEAATALDATVGYAMDPPTRTAIARLRAELLAPPPAEEQSAPQP